MKKATSLKLKKVPKSQPSISKFFSNGSTTNRKNVPFSNKPMDAVNIDSNSMDRQKRKMSPESDIVAADKNNTSKNFNDSKSNEQKKGNTKLSTVLLKGKYHNSTDHTVPDVCVSPKKKTKLCLTQKTIFSTGDTDKPKNPTKLTLLYDDIKSEKRLCNAENKMVNEFEDECDNLAKNFEDDILLAESLNDFETIEKKGLFKDDKIFDAIDKENLCSPPKCSPKDKKVKSPLKFSNSQVLGGGDDLNGLPNEAVYLEEFENAICEDFQDSFQEEFSIDDLEEEVLDLTTWQKCIVLLDTASECHMKRILHLKDAQGSAKAICWLQGFWMDAKIDKSSPISLLACRTPHTPNTFQITDGVGFLVTRPDLLVSGTSVVGSLFCRRKAVLQERFRGVDAPNKAMLIGSLVHQLFQTSLTKRLCDLPSITAECASMLDSVDVLYALHDAGVDADQVKQDVMKYALQIGQFVQRFVLGNKSSPSITPGKQDWKGRIENIVDIEENIWCPSIGVKGKIDVTLEVTVHDRKKERRLMPLELKTGRATVSAEHRGQVILYNMMLEQINTSLKPHDAGLLLYLKDTIGIHEVSAGHVEKRDLIMLRNDLAYYLSKWTDQEDLDPRGVVDLPDPVNHHSACGRCPYLTVCSVYLNASGNELYPQHSLQKLQSTALAHLTQEHRAYFLHWTHLICLEEREATVSKPLKDIWTLSPEQREKRGKCVIGVRVMEKVIQDGDSFYHTFISSTKGKDIGQSSGLQVGEYAVVSTGNKYAISSGTITHIHGDTISMLLQRDLTARNSMTTEYNIDTYETQTLVTYNLTNLGLLVENDDMANQLRSIIIDKHPASFDKKLPRIVVKQCKDILRRLNTVQQRAVLKVLASKDYLLIRGMPGTGKTQTIVALIEILYRLGKEVLVTSQTHSAVDNIFLRLKDKDMKLLRLGSSKRIHKDLLQYSEGHLLQENHKDLIELYSKAQVVGVTCLGSNHSLLTKRCFDICIVDESTQVLQPSILRPLFAAKRFVLIGDPDQLPPIVRSQRARQQGLDESLFVRLDNPESTTCLSVQYRMNISIMRLANHLTYQGKLQPANQTLENATLFNQKQVASIEEPNETWMKICMSNSLEDSVVFVNTADYNYSSKRSNNPGSHKGYTNLCEAEMVRRIIQQLVKRGIKGEQIGVIAPYREQVICLRETCQNTSMESIDKDDRLQIKDVEINTVDQFQGRDKTVVVFSCTKSRTNNENTGLKSTENEILEDHRRLTVAVTRAKCKLIILGDQNTLERYTPFRRLLEGIQQYGNIVRG